jgi:hypothetical protein
MLEFPAFVLQSFEFNPPLLVDRIQAVNLMADTF